MLSSRRAFLVTLIVLGLAACLFALWPNLDLAVAQSMYREGDGFVGRGLGWTIARNFFRVTPFLVLAGFAVLYVCRLRGVAVPYAPSAAGLVFLVVTLAVGPGLVVNLGLKDHAHRPRPTQTQGFGDGKWQFRPWYRFDGECKKNCSFVSGEASQGFWMLAPASLAPAPLLPAAMGGALAFGAAASLLRVAAGGHYLSDVVLSGLLTVLILQIAAWLILRDEASREGQEESNAADIRLANERRRRR